VEGFGFEFAGIFEFASTDFSIVAMVELEASMRMELISFQCALTTRAARACPMEVTVRFSATLSASFGSVGASPSVRKRLITCLADETRLAIANESRS